MADEKLDMTKEDLSALGISEEQEDLPGMLRELYDFVFSYHEPIFDRHASAMQFKLGDQWLYPRPPNFAMLVMNEVGPRIDIIASNMTEGEWVWRVSPRHFGVDAMVKIWNSLLEQAAEQDSVTTRNFGLFEQSFTKGYGIVKLSHDPQRGVPTHYEVLTPYEYMGEPGVRRPDIDGALHIHTAIKTAKEVREIWPDDWDKVKYTTMQELDNPSQYEILNERSGAKDNTHVTQIKEFWIKDDRMEQIPIGETNKQIESENLILRSGRPIYPMLAEDHSVHIKGHEADLEILRDEIERDLREMEAQFAQMEMQAGQGPGQMGQGGMPSPQGQMGQQGMQGGQGEQMPTIEEAFNTDKRAANARVHIQRHRDLLPDNPDGERTKYNGWRHIIAGGPDYEILHNGQTPYKDSLGRGITHFYALACIDSATDYFGLSIVEKAMEPQEIVNLTLSKMHDHLTYVATGVIVDTTRMSVPLNQIRAAPGGIFPVRGKPSDIVAPMAMSPIDRTAWDMLMIARSHIELITGVSDVHLGGYPPMERASEPMISKVAYLTEARWRAYHRQYADFLKKIGKGMLQIIQQFMTATTQVRIAQGLQVEYELVNKAEVQPDNSVLFINDLSVGEFDVDAQLKPMSAMTDEAKIDLAIRLYTLGKPDGSTLLDDQGFAEMVPDPILRETAIRNMQAKQAAQQREEALKQAYLKGEIEIDGETIPFTAEQYAALTGGKAPKTRSTGGSRMRPNPKAKAGYGKT